MFWTVINRDKALPQCNMSKDYELLQRLSSTASPILHFYEWEGSCATYGYFIKPNEHLNLENVRKRKLLLARRPTGGGIIFHAFDFAFSVLIPSSHPRFSLNTLENYAFVNRTIIAALQHFCSSPLQFELLLTPSKCESKTQNFCMAQPTKYDIVFQGCKVGGAAQRRTKEGFLHQGSIALKMPSQDLLRDVLKHFEPIGSAMLKHTFPLLGAENVSDNALQLAKNHLQELLIISFQKSDLRDALSLS